MVGSGQFLGRPFRRFWFKVPVWLLGILKTGRGSAELVPEHPDYQSLPKQGKETKVVARSKSGSRKRGVEFKGGSLHDGLGGFDGFGGSGELCLSYKYSTIRPPWRFWRFWRFRRSWRFQSWRLPPLNSTPPPPFPWSWKKGGSLKGFCYGFCTVKKKTVWERVLRRGLAMGFAVQKGSEKRGS